MPDSYGNKGVNEKGQLDPLRNTVSDIMHFMAMGNPNTSNLRGIADDLYRAMKNNTSVGGWSTSGGGGGTANSGNGDGKGGQGDLVYDPVTGAFVPRNPPAKVDGNKKEGVLSNVDMAPSTQMYRPIQPSMMTMQPMASGNMPTNYNQYLMRYLDPRYRGGV